MSYRRRRPYTYRRRRYPIRKRRKFARKSGGWLGTAAKALAVAYSVKRMLNVEYKSLDVNAAATNVGTGGTVILLNGIGQGDGSEQRDGDSIKFTSLLFRAQISKHASGTDQRVRVMLVISYDINGSSPAFTEVIDTSGAEPEVFSPRNLIRAKQHKVIYDKIIRVNTDKPSVDIEIFKKLNLKARYTGSGSSVATLYNGAIHLMCVSDDNTNYPTITYMSRLRFIDN